MSRLTRAEKVALVTEVIELAQTTFVGSEENMRMYFADEDTLRMNFILLRDDFGKLIGMASFQYYKLEYKGRELVVYKSAIGVAPHVRGNQFFLRATAIDAVIERLLHPFDNAWCFGTVLHPMSFALVSEVFADIYPSYNRPDDPEKAELADFMANFFGVEKADSPYPYVYKEVIRTRETESAGTYWRQRSDAAPRFFIERCPNYHLGESCIVMVAPLRALSIVFRTAKYIARKELAKLLKGNKTSSQTA